ncbi:hypothetical protein [Streptomyces sp. CA2R101]|uniref:hypothetical protein n=1 Tax=Streptomyces sp. CA2R101 TaxID=3120152 RepID=UPI00300A3D04
MPEQFSPAQEALHRFARSAGQRAGGLGFSGTPLGAAAGVAVDHAAEEIEPRDPGNPFD